MKRLLFFLGILIYTPILYSQQIPEQVVEYSSFTFTQSTTVPGFEGNLAMDKIDNNYSKTYFGANQDISNSSQGYGDINEECISKTAWWQVDFNDCYLLTGVQIAAPTELKNYYILYSEFPFYCSDLNTILSNRNVNYIHVTRSLEINQPLLFPIPKVAKYLRIQGDNSEMGIGLNEVSIFGRKIDCGTVPDVVKYGEDCHDKIDNDNDGLTDCQDWPCAAGEFYINYIAPTCPICKDGSICVVTNDHTKQVSIDGGQTFYSVEFTQKCFNNLGVGNYNVVVKSRFGCTSGDNNVSLVAPIGNPTSYCQNGDFEEGNFNNWHGGLSENFDGNPVFQNIDFDIQSNNPRHSIINVIGFEDPYIPEINGKLPELGKYIVKLGNNNNGSEAERLVYHFTVDNINKNFFFNYALVQQDPNDHPKNEKHDDEDRPFFYWKIYRESNPSEILFQNRTISNDPYLVKSPKIYDLYWEHHYKGWTCQNYDLSPYLGEDLVIEFINADCTLKGHYGYSYIDGICGKGFAPNPILTTKNTFCKDQYNENFEVKVEGAGFNSYFWDCKVVNSSGIITHQFTTQEEIGYSDIITDLIGFIYTNSNNNTPLACDSRIILGFNGQSNCFNQRVETEIFYSCVENSVQYCNPVYFCGGNQVNRVQILGDVNCVNCVYNWESSSPYGGLNNYEIKFPTVDRDRFYNAFNNTYYVTVTSPVGCVYNREVNIKPGPDVAITKEYNFPEECEETIPSARVFVKLSNVGYLSAHPYLSFIDNITGVRYSLTKDFGNSDENFNVWFGDFNLDKEYNLELDLSSYPEFSRYPTCFNQENEFCEFETFIHLDAVPPSPFIEPWVVYIPTIFSPDGDGLSDYFYLSNFQIDEDEPCSPEFWNSQLSPISYYKLQIFDRWGELMFEDELFADPFTGNGVNTREAKWNGYFKGYLCNPGVYTWLAEIHSCYEGNDYDHDCNIWPEGYKTDNQVITFIPGNVTIP